MPPRSRPAPLVACFVGSNAGWPAPAPLPPLPAGVPGWVAVHASAGRGHTGGRLLRAKPCRLRPLAFLLTLLVDMCLPASEGSSCWLRTCCLMLASPLVSVLQCAL